MKTFGIVLAALGGALALSGLKLIATEYNMSDSHDMSKAIGSLGVAVGMIAVGAYLAYANSDEGKDKDNSQDKDPSGEP
ncbi:hypothetical protein [Bremerella sp. P1]|uniref:hypothetical protein n=1 Tax=Bremerella sp. P1 TaxID=3026424 RepID=UPI002368131B|nr:hypothetical protein [Bremerella sp. P1]WDI42307.1 hypothetical protein PSR63_28035 [Bremerella sp. P1]